MNTVKPITCVYHKSNDEYAQVVNAGKKYYLATLVGKSRSGITYYEAIRTVSSVEYNNEYRNFYRVYLDPSDTFLIINNI